MGLSSSFFPSWSVHFHSFSFALARTVRRLIRSVQESSDQTARALHSARESSDRTARALQSLQQSVQAIQQEVRPVREATQQMDANLQLLTAQVHNCRARAINYRLEKAVRCESDSFIGQDPCQLCFLIMFVCVLIMFAFGEESLANRSMLLFLFSFSAFNF